MINLNQLRAFHQAAKHMNFSTAAKKLFITQPAVTAHLKLFEDHLGFKLFKKKGGKLNLTEEGKTIYKYSQKIFNAEEKLEEVIEELKKLKRGTLRLGTARTYARYCTPFLISHFHKPYPQIKIEMDEGSSQDMIQSLLDFKNELVVVAEVGHRPDICFFPFSREELILVLSPRHRLAGKNHISFPEIAGEPIIMKEPGSGTRMLVDKLFEDNNCIPKIRMEMSNAEMTKLLVQHGEGVSFLVRGAVERELNEKQLVTVPLQGQKMFLDVSIGYLKDQPLSPPAQRFLGNLEYLKSENACFEDIGHLMDEMPSSPPQ